MTLKNILNGIEYKLVKGNLDIEITDIVWDSRKATEGVAFVCISGTQLDAHRFIEPAVSAGASVVVISKDVDVDYDVTVIRVFDDRKTLALMSINFFDSPATKMKTIGITGTKGKTTTTYMLKKIFETAGKKVGLIGTNGVTIGDEHYKTKHTTPESYDLQKYFRMMVDAGCEYMIMEAASISFKMSRVGGITYDVGAFLNISPDHIGPGEHESFDEYLKYKSMILSMCKTGFINADDEHFEKVAEGHTCELHSFGINNDTEYNASNINDIYEENFLGESFDYSGKNSFNVKLGIPGKFNVSNALAAIAIAEHFGTSEKEIKEALCNIQVDGRMQLAHISNHCTVIIDYAHNGVSARSMLETLKSYNPKRLVVVFGCGGNRAKERRTEMGEAVGSVADLAIITTDNPRFENPENIVKDIHVGFDKSPCEYKEIPDRKQAIYSAIADSEPGDMIAIIGKGHEDYQEVCGVRTHLSDIEEVEKAISKLGW